jgi:2-hydroxychromene-2-carboxylate isomerase
VTNVQELFDLSNQVAGLIERTGDTLVRRPMLTVMLRELVGHRSPMTVENKARWMMGELDRFSKRYGVPIEMNPNFIRETPEGCEMRSRFWMGEAYLRALPEGNPLDRVLETRFVRRRILHE